MYKIMQNIKAPYMGAFFLIIFIVTTTVIGMESELKQRFLINNPNDIKILIEESTIEDCSICYEEKEVITIPCKEGEKHPRICKICLDGCNELCPFCRSTLIIEKKRKAHQNNYDHLCIGTSCGCLTIYLYILFTVFG